MWIYSNLYSRLMPLSATVTQATGHTSSKPSFTVIKKWSLLTASNMYSSMSVFSVCAFFKWFLHAFSLCLWGTLCYASFHCVISKNTIWKKGQGRWYHRRCDTLAFDSFDRNSCCCYRVVTRPERICSSSTWRTFLPARMARLRERALIKVISVQSEMIVDQLIIG